MADYSQAFAYPLPVDNTLRLRDLVGQVKSVLSGAFRNYYWIVAEVRELSYSRAGHYYFVLSDPLPDGQMAASVRANLWANTARVVLQRFRTVAKQELQVGMELLMQVKVEMHPVYGFSLTIVDINPQYTLGNLERLREATIQRLKDDGVFELNKQLPLPTLLLRVAVISSETAAGYGDFITTLKQSGLYPFFSVKLFQATMQGVNTTLTVNTAFSKIYYYREEFDAVFIMRGGGSKQDLAAFDDYDLCTTIANFPLPVLTAIGHEQDTSVADLVAHTRLKTPTALGEFLVRKLAEEILHIQELRADLSKAMTERMSEASIRVLNLTTRTHNYLTTLCHNQERNLTQKTHRADRILSDKLSKERNRVIAGTQTLRFTLKHSIEADHQRLNQLQHRLPLRLSVLKSDSVGRLSGVTSRLRNNLQTTAQTNRQKLSHLSAVLRTSLLSARQNSRHQVDLSISRLSSKLPSLYASVSLTLPPMRHRLMVATSTSKERERIMLKDLERRLQLLDPKRIMARGFVVAVTAQGEPLTEIKQLEEGGLLTLSLLDGQSIVETKKILPNS